MKHCGMPMHPKLIPSTFRAKITNSLFANWGERSRSTNEDWSMKCETFRDQASHVAKQLSQAGNGSEKFNARQNRSQNESQNDSTRSGDNSTNQSDIDKRIAAGKPFSPAEYHKLSRAQKKQLYDIRKSRRENQAPSSQATGTGTLPSQYNANQAVVAPGTITEPFIDPSTGTSQFRVASSQAIPSPAVDSASTTPKASNTTQNSTHPVNQS